jgi:hypothetical protein
LPSPLLHAPPDYPGVAEIQGSGDALQEAAFSGCGLDQIDLRVRQRDREHQAREAGATADVGEAVRLSQALDLQAGQAVRQVNVHRLERV